MPYWIVTYKTTETSSWITVFFQSDAERTGREKAERHFKTLCKRNPFEARCMEAKMVVRHGPVDTKEVEVADGGH